MDPLSIAAACFSLAGVTAKTLTAIVEFRRDVRDAPKDMDAIATELKAIAAMLTPLAGSLSTVATMAPAALIQKVEGVLSGCTAVVEQIDRTIQKYQENRLFTRMNWIMFGQSDMEKLRESLEAYKIALDLGMHVISLYACPCFSYLVRSRCLANSDCHRSATQAVRQDTIIIREQNETIRANTNAILSRLEVMRSTRASSRQRRVQGWMDDISALSVYADTVYNESLTESMADISVIASFLRLAFPPPVLGCLYGLGLEQSNRYENLANKSVAQATQESLNQQRQTDSEKDQPQNITNQSKSKQSQHQDPSTTPDMPNHKKEADSSYTRSVLPQPVGMRVNEPSKSGSAGPRVPSQAWNLRDRILAKQNTPEGRAAKAYITGVEQYSD